MFREVRVSVSIVHSSSDIQIEIPGWKHGSIGMTNCVQSGMVQVNSIVNMHLPDSWGFVQFVLDSFAGLLFDEHYPEKLLCSQLYYAQHKVKQLHGEFSNDIDHICTIGKIDQSLMRGFSLQLSCSPSEFTITITKLGQQSKSALQGSRITHDRLVQIVDIDVGEPIGHLN